MAACFQIHRLAYPDFTPSFLFIPCTSFSSLLSVHPMFILPLWGQLDFSDSSLGSQQCLPQFSCGHTIHCPHWSQSDLLKLKSDSATPPVCVFLFSLKSKPLKFLMIFNNPSFSYCCSIISQHLLPPTFLPFIKQLIILEFFMFFFVFRTLWKLFYFSLMLCSFIHFMFRSFIHFMFHHLSSAALPDI